jgi:hypothetical protein
MSTKDEKDEKESDFEDHIRKIISKKIIAGKKHFTMFKNKDVVDIIICRNIFVPKIFFIEVKHYSETKGRIGFGKGDGGGLQPEILKSVLKNGAKYFDNNLIWVFKREHDENYYVLKCKDCLKYIAADTIGEKQNNFKKSLFDNEQPMSEEIFLEYIENWLLDVDENNQ